VVRVIKISYVDFGGDDCKDGDDGEDDEMRNV
jgi:hypothetical protein